jgi:hypothetical protein
VVLDLNGSMMPRDNTTDVCDLYLTGTLLFNLPERTDNFTVELRGSRVRSFFFLKQVSGGANPIVAEIEGLWYEYEEPMYVACEGRLGVPVDNGFAKAYVFVLRNRDLEGELLTPGGTRFSWLGRLTVLADEVADSLVDMGTTAQTQFANLIDWLAEAFVGAAYFA